MAVVNFFADDFIGSGDVLGQEPTVGFPARPGLAYELGPSGVGMAETATGAGAAAFNAENQYGVDPFDPLSGDPTGITNFTLDFEWVAPTPMSWSTGGSFEEFFQIVVYCADPEDFDFNGTHVATLYTFNGTAFSLTGSSNSETPSPQAVTPVAGTTYPGQMIVAGTALTVNFLGETFTVDSGFAFTVMRLVFRAGRNGRIKNVTASGDSSLDPGPPSEFWEGFVNTYEVP